MRAVARLPPLTGRHAGIGLEGWTALVKAELATDDIIASARDLATGGRVDDSALKNIESQFGRVQDRAKDAGVQVEERETSLRQ